MILLSVAGRDRLSVLVAQDAPEEVRTVLRSLLGTRESRKSPGYGFFLAVHDFPLFKEKLDRLGIVNGREIDEDAASMIRAYRGALALNERIKAGDLNVEIEPVLGLLKSKLWTDQVADVRFCLRNQKVGVWNEMGCVDGEAIVRINRAGIGKPIKLAKLYHKFHGGNDRGRKWDLEIPTRIRSLCNGELRLHHVMDVLDKGIRKVVKLHLASGKTLRLTPEHEVATPDGFICVNQLTHGDAVLTNGVRRFGATNPNWKGGKFVDGEDRVVSLKPDGDAHVFDVVCADPHRNFVANGVIVHNCGKTNVALATFVALQTRGLARYGLVVCPNPVKQNWLRQTTQHTHLTATEMGNGREENLARLAAHAKTRTDICVIHYEALRIDEVRDKLIELPFDIAVIDEVHRAKHLSTVVAQSMFDVLDRIRPSVSLVEADVELPDGTVVQAVLPTGSKVGDTVDFW